DIGRKIRDRWPTFKDWSAQKPDAQAAVKATFLPQVKARYLTFTQENSVFPEARHHFLQMNSLAGNAAQAVTLVPPALGEVSRAVRIVRPKLHGSWLIPRLNFVSTVERTTTPFSGG